MLPEALPQGARIYRLVLNFSSLFVSQARLRHSVKVNSISRLALLLFGAVLSSAGYGQGDLDKAPKLNIGSSAPALTAKWLQKPITSGLKKGHVYVVDLWATWCGPCIHSFAHTAKLWKQYKTKATFVAISVMESDPSRVGPFVKSRSDMPFSVGADSDNRMARTWLNAAGAPGIPTTFIVDKTGRIAWIGHPSKLDEPLRQVLGGTWDIDKHKSDWQAERKASIIQMRNVKPPEPGEPHYAYLQLFKELNSAFKAKDNQRILQLSDALETDPVILKEEGTVVIFEAYVQRFAAYKDMGREEDWYRCADEVIQKAKSHPANKGIASGLLNMIVDTILEPKSFLKSHDYAKALEYANASKAIWGKKEFVNYELIARCYEKLRDRKSALAWAKLALAIADNTADKEEAKDLLHRLSK